MRHVPLALTLVFVLCGCSSAKAPDIDVLDQDTRGQVVFATTQCTVPNADGVRCDKKTCKTDQRGDCAVFADKCRNSGHQYIGSNDDGACVRDPTPVG
jgi:hypothetical protein